MVNVDEKLYAAGVLGPQRQRHQRVARLGNFADEADVSVPVRFVSESALYEPTGGEQEIRTTLRRRSVVASVTTALLLRDWCRLRSGVFFTS